MPDICLAPANFIWREHDAERLNLVLNHPEVRPWVADASEGALDVQASAANPDNVLLMGAWGGCLCFRLLPGIYEVHTQILPEGRGEWALDFVRAGSHWMFTRTDAYEIITRVPHGHVAARALTVAAGMSREFSRPDGCRFLGELRAVDVYSFRIQDWMRRAPGLTERGAWFHHQLQAEAARLGVSEPAHGADPDHDRVVGAVFDMIQGGQVKKGVALYNRWALVARQKLIQIVSETPPVIQFDIGRLRFAGQGIEVTQ